MTSYVSTVDGPGSDKDQKRTNPKEGVSYVTLNPFTPPYAKRRQKLNKKTMNFDDLFGPQKWTKYFEMEHAQVKDDFKLYSKLAVEVGSDVLFHHQKDGHCIIEAASEEQSEKLQQLIYAEDPNLPIKRNETLNVCHGTVIVPNDVETGDKQFSECSEKIKENIKLQGLEVKKVETYIKPARGNRRYPLRIAKIIFEGRILPDMVVVAGQRLSVREYIPAPRQCAKCWKYGHGSKYCKSDLHVCPICGMTGHQKDNCSQKTNKMCVNCHGNHPAFSKACAEYKKEQLIEKVRFKEGLSYRAALNKLKQTGDITSHNYKKALDSKRPPVTSTPQMPGFNATNRFSVLQMEESENQSFAENISQISPRRTAKRNRDNSSEERLSPKLNPKQRPKTKNQDKEAELHEVTVEIHAVNDLSLDDTIIYTDKGNEKLNVDAGRTSSPANTPSELASPTVLPPKSSVLPSELPSPSVAPSELPSPSVAPSELPSPSVTPSELPSPPVAPSELPSPPVAPYELPSPLVAPPELPLKTAAPSKPTLPTAAPSKPTLPTAAPSKSTLPTAAPLKSPLPKKSQPAKAASMNTSKNVKINTTKVPSKNPMKIGKHEPYPNKIKNLVRDYHMPPGFQGGK